MAAAAPVLAPAPRSPLAGLSLGPSEPAVVNETPERRQLKAELLDIQKILQESRMHDPLTKQLRDWCTCFSFYVEREESVEKAVNAYVPLLRDMLVDPWTAQLLDDEPFLGSDDRTYSKTTLDRFSREAPEKFRERAPLDPNNEARFTKTPHPAATALVAWLKKRGAYQLPRPEARQYRDLNAPRQLLSSNPEATVERIRQLRAIHGARGAREENKEYKEHKGNGAGEVAVFHQQVSQIFANAFAPVHGRIQEAAQRNMLRLAAHHDQMQEQLAAIQQEIERLDREIEGLPRGNQQLNGHLREAEAGLERSRIGTRRLEQDFKDIQTDNHKKKKRKLLKDLVTAAAIIGACAFVSWALPQVLAGAGATGATAGAQAGPGAIGLRVGFIF